MVYDWCGSKNKHQKTCVGKRLTTFPRVANHSRSNSQHNLRVGGGEGGLYDHLITHKISSL